MRLVIGGALVYRSSTLLISHPPSLLAIAYVLLIGAGILLLAGLWTPIAGTIVALVELWKIFAVPNNTWAYVFAATIAAALAMIGPGAWSLDARLFGWKRIDPQDREPFLVWYSAIPQKSHPIHTQHSQRFSP